MTDIKNADSLSKRSFSAACLLKPLQLMHVRGLKILFMAPTAKHFKNKRKVDLSFKGLLTIVILVIVIKSVACTAKTAFNSQHLNYVIFHVGIR